MKTMTIPAYIEVKALEYAPIHECTAADLRASLARDVEFEREVERRKQITWLIKKMDEVGATGTVGEFLENRPRVAA